MASKDQHNQQHINNTTGNQGAQGIFYGDVHIHISPAPAQPDTPGTAAAPSERQQEVELFTKPPTGTTAQQPRSIDWSQFFAANSRPHRDDVWQTVLLPDLDLLRGELGQNRVQRVLLYPRLHNGLGFGIGYTFRRSMRLTIEQPFPNAGVQMWPSDASPESTVQLAIEEEAGSIDGRALVFAISISRAVGLSVDRWLQSPDAPTVRRRVWVAPPGGPSFEAVPDSVHAAAFANQIGTLLRRKRDQAPGVPIYLFAALPLGLEILIGLHLNACEPVQVYGYDNAQAAYYPFYQLG